MARSLRRWLPLVLILLTSCGAQLPTTHAPGVARSGVAAGAQPNASIAPFATSTAALVPTPNPATSLGGIQEIADTPGDMVPWARQSRTPALAIQPERGNAAVAWLAWGGTGGSDARVGDVWVRTQAPQGDWRPAQTVSTRPVLNAWGGLGIAWTISDTITIVYGGGAAQGDRSIYQVTSADSGETWGVPTPIAGLLGRVVDLQTDAHGGLHLLSIGPDAFAGGASYSYLPTGAAAWQTTHVGGRLFDNGALTVLNRADGSVRSFVFGIRLLTLTVWSSDDRQNWTPHALETGRYFPERTGFVATSLVAAARPTGDVVAAAWSQVPGPGDARGGVFAAVSLDGGTTWGREERIAQHETTGRVFDLAMRGLLAGFEPSLVYDRVSDQLVVSWVEEDIAQRTGSRFGAGLRTVGSVRSLTTFTNAAADWSNARTPTNHAAPLIELAPWGNHGWLYGGADGRKHWLVFVETRNTVERVVVQPIVPSYLFVEAVS